MWFWLILTIATLEQYANRHMISSYEIIWNHVTSIINIHKLQILWYNKRIEKFQHTGGVEATCPYLWSHNRKTLRMHLWRFKPESLRFDLWQECTLQSTVNDFMCTGLHWQISMHSLPPSAFSRLLKKPRVRSSERLGMESSKGKVPPGESRVQNLQNSQLWWNAGRAWKTLNLFVPSGCHTSACSLGGLWCQWSTGSKLSDHV